MAAFTRKGPSPGEKPDACPHSSSCAMYGILSYAGTLAAWKVRYCDADYKACARYQRAAKNQPVPINLMPNGALLKKPGM